MVLTAIRRGESDMTEAEVSRIEEELLGVPGREHRGHRP